MKFLALPLLCCTLAFASCHTTKKTAAAGNDKTDCRLVMCTRMFASAGLHVIDATGSPVRLDDAYTVRISTGEVIRYEKSGAGQGQYIVIDDSYLKMLSNKTDQFQFIGMKDDRQVVQETFTISADCCHVKKDEGRDEVTVK